MSFGALAGRSTVALDWRPASELDNLGFHLYRSLSPEGLWTRITPTLIPGLGSSPEGASYSFRDNGLQNETTYFYKLEDIDATSGSSYHGPVSATPSASAVPPEEEDGEEQDETQQYRDRNDVDREVQHRVPIECAVAHGYRVWRPSLRGYWFITVDSLPTQHARQDDPGE